ncbi:MAG: peptidylprolyl isomerase, partial [Pirellulaceae bacterium]
MSPAAQPCCAKQTLPEFLGLDKLAGGVFRGIRGLGARLSARLDLAGRFPAIQDPPPPVLAITDPANLGPDAPPAVQAAAEVKAEEDAAAQKVQALKYLAKIGCGGCYPSVEGALLAALDDCTEIVRYEAAVALRGSDTACRYCSSDACCSIAVQKKLQKIAYETDDTGCPLEPSDRVRREARLALAACGGYMETIDVPEEGPEAPTLATQELAGQPSLYDTIQLVSFAESGPVDEADDIVLAQVNGQAIFESQVAALVESELGGRGVAYESPGGRKQYRAEMRRQLARVIDSTLLRQAARRDLRLLQEPTPSQTASWLDQELDVNTDVHPAEIANLYARERSKYNVPAKVRWERITISLASYPDRKQAHDVISYLRHRATGVPVRAVPGFDPSAVETRTHAWSTRHQISSPLIADMVFRLPVGQLSPIIEDQQAFHLVRVLERVAARTTSQEEVADEIRQRIIAQR